MEEKSGQNPILKMGRDGMNFFLKWIFAALVVLFALLQLTNPAFTNPPIKNDFPVTNAPPRVAALLRAACYDCHSNETRWPWYSHIAPFSWQISKDVNDGRENLNFSDWPNDNPIRAAKKMEDMSEEIGYGEMPLKKYTLIHAGARLTKNERQALEDWLDAQAARLKSIAATKN